MRTNAQVQRYQNNSTVPHCLHVVVVILVVLALLGLQISFNYVLHFTAIWKKYLAIIAIPKSSNVVADRLQSVGKWLSMTIQWIPLLQWVVVVSIFKHHFKFRFSTVLGKRGVLRALCNNSIGIIYATSVCPEIKSRHITDMRIIILSRQMHDIRY